MTENGLLSVFYYACFVMFSLSPAYSDRKRFGYLLAAPAIATEAVNQKHEDEENNNPPDPGPCAVAGITEAPAIAAAAGITGVTGIAAVAVVIIAVTAATTVFTFIIPASAGRYLFIHNKTSSNMQKAI